MNENTGEDLLDLKERMEKEHLDSLEALSKQLGKQCEIEKDDVSITIT